MDLKHLWEAPSNWNIQNFPAAYSTIPARVTKDKTLGAFTAMSTKAYTSLNAYTLCALDAIFGNTSIPLCLVRVTDTEYAAEIKVTRKNSLGQDFDGGVFVCAVSNRGNVRASIIDPTTKRVSPPATFDKQFSDMEPEAAIAFNAVYLMLVAYTNMLDASNEATKQNIADYLAALKDKYAPDKPLNGFDETDITKIRYISEAMYQFGTRGMLKDNISNGNISMLQEKSLQALQGETLCGTPILLGNTPGKAKALTAKEAKAMFASYKHREWTEKERQFIPKFDDDYPVMEESIKIARRFVESRNCRRPMSNFLWRGTTSYGKSTGVAMIAYLLDTPLLRLTCSSNMEAQDFLSSFVPDNSVPKKTELPSLCEIEADPEAAYFKVTGKKKPDVSCEECLAACYEAAADARGSSTARFKLVESNFVRALRKGYICEVQEMSRIRDAGIMVTLNEYDRAGAMIPRVDGTTARRHQDAMVIYTDNVGYVSCRPVDPSVMRRMDCVIDSFELTDEQVVSRVKYNTGFSDKGLLGKLIKVWRHIIEFCRESEITSGEISVNELERWVNIIQIEGDAPDVIKCAAIEAMVAKASPDRETQDSLKAELETTLAKYKLI